MAKTDLMPWTKHVLSSENLKKHDLFDPGTVRSIIEQHSSGRENHDTLIWSMLVFQRWFELYMY